MIVVTSTTIFELRELMHDKGVGSFLVTDASNKLLGIVSTRDLTFIGTFHILFLFFLPHLDPNNKTITVGQVMTPREKLVVAPTNVALEDAKDLLKKNRLEKLPLVDDQDHLTGLITAKDIMYKLQRPYATLDSKGQLRVSVVWERRLI